MNSHTAIFYTHNLIDEDLLRLSIGHFQSMVERDGLIFNTKGVIVSCEPIDLFLINHANPLIVNIIAPERIRNLGHLSIIEKITLAMQAFPSDFVSLHEHDVLYPEDYLLVCQELLEDYSSIFDYIAYDRIMGVNKTGYVDRRISDSPLSCLSFRTNILEQHLVSKRREIMKNHGWCYLEPGYGGSTGGNLRKLSAGVSCTNPILHVNMNKTRNNHHLTNHYMTYESISKNGFTEWPGDLSYLFS